MFIKFEVDTQNGFLKLNANVKMLSDRRDIWTLLI